MVSRGEVTSRTLPGGRAVTLLHHGPYETLGDSYKVLLDYVMLTQVGKMPSLRPPTVVEPGHIVLIETSGA